MKKKLKKYGNTLVVSFTAEEQKIYGLVEGDVIDISDMLVEGKEDEKEKERIKEEGEWGYE